MGRSMIFFGIILIFVAVGLMIAVFAAESIPFVEDIMVDRYCEAPETSITSASRLSFSGTQNSSTVWFCDDNEGNQREITNQIGLTAVAVFLVPFLIGLFMTMGGAWVIQKRVREEMLGVFNPNQAYTIQNGEQINLSETNIFSKGGEQIDLANANMSDAQREQVERVLGTVMGAFGLSPTGSSSLVDRLKQLEEARNQGLISSAEYERTRQAILDSMDDNL